MSIYGVFPLSQHLVFPIDIEVGVLCVAPVLFCTKKVMFLNLKKMDFKLIFCVQD